MMTAAVAAFAVASSFPHAGGKTSRHDVDLREAPVRISGAADVAAAGDVNGDGIPDLLVSRGDIVKRPTRGRTWVVFGSPTMGRVIRVNDLGDGGFVIEGAQEDDYASRIASAGDVNADGLDDVIVGASGASNNGRSSSGTAYVVFGKAGSDPVLLRDFDLGIQGERGFRIDGPVDRALAGEDVAGLGDVNADGKDDVLVGAPFGAASYVVFGKGDGLPVDLRAWDFGESTSGGFRIDTPSPQYSSDYAVSGAGDVNGDGVPDAIIGAQRRPGANGDAFVVFGTTTERRVEVTKPGEWGFRVKGHYGRSATGYAVAPAGDLNQDGLDDVIVAAPALNFPLQGQTFVVYGKRGFSSVELGDLGRKGFVVNGVGPSASGAAVAGGHDVGGDGLPDLVIGAPYASFGRRDTAGKAYVVYGSGSRDTVYLRKLGSRGVTVIGARGSPEECRPDFSYCPGDYAGSTVAQLGDIDGDGNSEIAVGAPWAGRPSQMGRVYLLWSKTL